MVAVCNFSNLLTLIIFNGFSLQADGGEGTGSSATCAGGSLATLALGSPVHSSSRNCWFGTIIQQGITFSSMK